MREWVISLTVVLADGIIISTRHRPRNSSAGYDLTRLFIGSQGTLGLIVEATLKVTVEANNENVAIANSETIRDAAQCVSRVVDAGIPIAAVEIMDGHPPVFKSTSIWCRSWPKEPKALIL